MNIGETETISSASEKLNVQSLLHPDERSSFVLAMVFCGPTLIVASIITLASFGVILIYVGLVVTAAWFSLRIARAHFIGHNVKVSDINFPEIYQMLQSIKQRLDFYEKVDIYIIEEGSVDARFARFFRTKFIVLHSGMAENLHTKEGRKQLEFVIARFVGDLKAKRVRLDLFRILFNGMRKLIVFNLFLLPYERAVVYSGDQIGLAVCQDLPNTLRALNRMMVGNRLFGDVNPSAVLSQAQEVSGPFGYIAQLLSAHPHMVNRYLNLLAFARSRYPSLYEAYVSEQDESLRPQLDLSLQRVTVHQ